MDHPEYTKEEILHRGMELYEREIRSEVEPGHEGEFLAVDVRSGAWELGEDGLSASKCILAREPEAVVCLLKVGHAAAHRIRAHLGAGSSMDGRVTAGGEAILPVRVLAPASTEAGPSAEVQAVIDTGFTIRTSLPLLSAKQFP